jgi:hypothetical protein
MRKAAHATSTPKIPTNSHRSNTAARIAARSRQEEQQHQLSFPPIHHSMIWPLDATAVRFL